MAKKRKRRKGAGPQPSPQRRDEGSGLERPQMKKRKAGDEPVLPSFNGVLIRSGIVAALFYPYLVFIAGQSSQTALLVTAAAFAVMIPLGMAFDRVRYRMQMKRWREKRGQGGE